MAYFSLYWLKHYDEINKASPPWDQNNVHGYPLKDLEWMKQKGIYKAGIQCDGDPGKPYNLFGGVESGCNTIWVSKNGTVYYYKDLKDLDIGGKTEDPTFGQNRSKYQFENDTDQPQFGKNKININNIPTVLPVVKTNPVLDNRDVTGNNNDPNQNKYPRHQFRDIEDLYKDFEERASSIKDRNSGGTGMPSRGPSGGRSAGTGGTSKGPSGHKCKCDDHENEEDSKERDRKAPVNTTKEQSTDKSDLDDCAAKNVTRSAPNTPVSKTQAREPLPDTEKERVVSTIMDQLQDEEHSDSEWRNVKVGDIVAEYKKYGYVVDLNLDVAKETEEDVDLNLSWTGSSSGATPNKVSTTKVNTDFEYIRNFKTKLADGSKKNERFVIFNVKATVHTDGSVSLNNVHHIESVPNDEPGSADFDDCENEKEKPFRSKGGMGKTSVGVKEKEKCKCDDKKGGTKSPSNHGGGTHSHSGVSGKPKEKKKDECDPDATTEEVTPTNDVTEKEDITPKNELTDKNEVTSTPLVRDRDYNPKDYPKIPLARFIDTPSEFSTEPFDQKVKSQQQKETDPCDATILTQKSNGNPAWWVEWFDKVGFNMYKIAINNGTTVHGALLVLAQSWRECVSENHGEIGYRTNNWWGLKKMLNREAILRQFDSLEACEKYYFTIIKEKWGDFWDILTHNFFPSSTQLHLALKNGVERKGYCFECTKEIYSDDILDKILKPNTRRFLDYLVFKINCLEHSSKSNSNTQQLLELKRLQMELLTIYPDLKPNINI